MSNINTDTFLADVHRAIQPAVRSAQRNNRDLQQLSRPGYWLEQQARIGVARSWDAIAELILTE